MQSLAVKYRPKTFDEIVSQKYIKDILLKQLETNNIKNCYLFAGASGCVDKDTEYFNGNVWKKISEYEDGDKVLVFDPKTRNAFLEVPERYIKLSCNKFNVFKTKYGIDMQLSDDHTIVYETSKGHINTKQCDNFVNLHNNSKWGFDARFLTTFNYSGSGIDLTDSEIKLMCAVICDGSFRKNSSTSWCCVNLKKERKINLLRSILQECGYDYTETKQKTNYTRFYFNAPRKEKEFTTYWYDCSNHQLQIICDNILNWDGSISNNRKTFTQKNKSTIDFIQFAFASCGYRCSIKEIIRNRTKIVNKKVYQYPNEKYYILHITDKNKVSLGKTKITTTDSVDGFKYCFTVSTHMWIMRRNGNIIITSNCGKTTIARAFATLINKGKGNPIEIDAASHNSVEDVRDIIEGAKLRSIDSEYKIYVVDECVTGDTEILTDGGFKRFDQLDKTELVAQYDKGKITFVKPVEYIEKDYIGEMYKLAIGNKGSFYMTPNHVQPLFYEKSKMIKEKYVSDLKPCQTNRFITAGEGVGHLIELTSVDKLAIALQADGTLQQSWKTHNYWTIQLKKERKINRLLDLLEKSNLDYKEIKSSRTGYRRFSILTPISITKLFNTHFDLTSMSKKFAEEFIEELMLWDGYRKNNSKYYYYSSTCKENVDFAQGIGILGGFKSRISIQEDYRKDTYKTIYRLYLQKSYVSTPNSSVRKTKIQYTGKIYCVKVPSHNIIIRRDNIEIITGNCHSITTQGWQAFLKTIEEAPEKTIFMFCTTNPEKIPITIQNRVMRFNLTKIPTKEIRDRLEYICQQENIIDKDNCCDYIAKLANGGMRDAIAYLEKVSDYSKEITIENTLNILGSYSYDDLLELTNAIIDGNQSKVIDIIENLDSSGKNLKNFVDEYMKFILDLSKYSLFKDISMTTFPLSLEDKVKYAVSFDKNVEAFNLIIDSLLELKQTIRYDDTYTLTIKGYFVRILERIKELWKTL